MKVFFVFLFVLTSQLTIAQEGQISIKGQTFAVDYNYISDDNLYVNKSGVFEDEIKWTGVLNDKVVKTQSEERREKDMRNFDNPESIKLVQAGSQLTVLIEAYIGAPTMELEVELIEGSFNDYLEGKKVVVKTTDSRKNSEERLKQIEDILENQANTIISSFLNLEEGSYTLGEIETDGVDESYEFIFKGKAASKTLVQGSEYNHIINFTVTGK